MILTNEQKEQVIAYYNAYKAWLADDEETVKHPMYYEGDEHLQGFTRYRTRSAIADTVQLAVRYDKGIDRAFALLYTMGYEVSE